MLGNVRASRGGMRTRVTYRGRGRQISMRGPRRGGRGMGRGGAQATVKQKDPCSVYVSFVNPIEAVCAAELLEVAKGAKATVKFGRHCYLTFGTESESSASLSKASEKEFGGQKAYVDHAYKSQSAKAGGKREAEVTVQASPTKKLKINTSGPKVEKEAVEKVEKMEEDTTEVEEEGKEEEEEEEMADNGAEEAA